jgi:hypothetical protein
MLFCWYKDIPARFKKRIYIVKLWRKWTEDSIFKIRNTSSKAPCVTRCFFLWQGIDTKKSLVESRKERKNVKLKQIRGGRDSRGYRSRIQSVEVSKASEIVCFRWGKMVQWESTDKNVFQQSWNWRILARSLWYLRWIAQSLKFRPFKNWLIQTILIPAKILNWKK